MKSVTHILNVFSPDEADVNSLLKQLSDAEDGVEIEVVCANEISVKITATAETILDAENICAKFMLRAKELLGDCVYASDSDGLQFEAVNLLRKHKLKIATAESCTGGMLSQYLTSVPNSSEVVEIGITAYSDRIKREALSIPENILNEFGAISPQTAMYLAKNVRALGDASIGIGITGNAGPSASENKPVGLVYIAIADRAKYYVKKLELPVSYGREKIRSIATFTALDLIRKYTSALPYSMSGMVDLNQEFTFDNQEQQANFSEAQPEETSPTMFDPNINFVIYETSETDDQVQFNQKRETPVFSPSFLTAVKNFVYSAKSGLLSILPSKKDNLRDIIIKSVSILSAIALIVSSAVIISHFANENKQRAIIEDARNFFNFENNEKTENNTYVSFNELIKQNSDIKGWISISNTNVNNPIYQTDDNDFYLNHNMLGEKSRYGALFFDYRNSVSADNISQNLTVYGHNMKDKSMFGSLDSYRDLNFYKQNPVINLKTLFSEHKYVIFAIMITNASSKDDNGYLYNYTTPVFKNQDEFLLWIDEAKQRSLVSTDITVEKHDQILTLSTCCYDFDNARFVVMAKRLADGEDVPNLSSAKLNPNVRYPQVWYDKRGLDGYVESQTQSTDGESEDTQIDVSDEQSSEGSSSESSTPTVSPTPNSSLSVPSSPNTPSSSESPSSEDSETPSEESSETQSTSEESQPEENSSDESTSQESSDNTTTENNSDQSSSQ